MTTTGQVATQGDARSEAEPDESLREYVRALVDRFPPLSQEKRGRLAALFSAAE